jgi:Flp pilus assembly protein TadD
MSQVTRNLRTMFVFFLLVFAGTVAANLGDTDDDDLENPMIAQGKSELQNENWAGAIAVFEEALKANSGSADLHNFLGYAYRKSGNLKSAFEHYGKALEINPDHKGALEYLGEAYIQSGDLMSAEQQLTKLKKICSPIPCEELRELQAAIDEAKK